MLQKWRNRRSCGWGVQAQTPMQRRWQVCEAHHEHTEVGVFTRQRGLHIERLQDHLVGRVGQAVQERGGQVPLGCEHLAARAHQQNRDPPGGAGRVSTQRLPRKLLEPHLRAASRVGSLPSDTSCSSTARTAFRSKPSLAAGCRASSASFVLHGAHVWVSACAVWHGGKCARRTAAPQEPRAPQGETGTGGSRRAPRRRKASSCRGRARQTLAAK